MMGVPTAIVHKLSRNNICHENRSLFELAVQIKLSTGYIMFRRGDPTKRGTQVRGVLKKDGKSQRHRGNEMD